MGKNRIEIGDAIDIETNGKFWSGCKFAQTAHNGNLIFDQTKVYRLEGDSLVPVFDGVYTRFNNVLEAGEKLWGVNVGKWDEGEEAVRITDIQNCDPRGLEFQIKIPGHFVLGSGEDYPSVVSDGTRICLKKDGLEGIRMIDPVTGRQTQEELVGFGWVGGMVPFEEGYFIVGWDRIGFVKNGDLVPGRTVRVKRDFSNLKIDGAVLYRVNREDDERKVKIEAVDLKTRRKMWTFTTPEKVSHLVGDFLGSQGHAYLPVWDERGKGHKFSYWDICNGELSARFDFEANKGHKWMFAEGENLWVHGRERLAVINNGRTVTDTYVPGEIKDHLRTEDALYLLVSNSSDRGMLKRIPIRSSSSE